MEIGDYDPFGRRLWKDVGGTKIYFFYSEDGLIGEYDASGTEIRSYGYKPDSAWTTDPLFMKQGTEYYFYQNDHLGTPQKLVGVNGAVVWSAQYSAFGEADVQVETVTNNLRFSGQYADDETGLYYNFQRYYEPTSGRYINVDPVGMNGGDLNLYGYAHNNSVNRTDSLGMWAANLTMLARIFTERPLHYQNETHESLTEQALNGLSPKILRKFFSWSSIDMIEYLLINGNVNQDLAFNVLNDPKIPFIDWVPGPADPEHQRRHYGMQDNWTRKDARDKYLEYLQYEEDRFNAYMKPGASWPDTPSAGWPDLPTFEACCDALISLGQLSHSWQDYYGHGVTSNAMCPTSNPSGYSMDISCLALQMPLFTYGPPIMYLGSPDHPVLWPIKTHIGGPLPSGYGEHQEGGVEPIYHGGPKSDGYDIRVREAIAFTRQGFKKHLTTWADKCQCYDYQFWDLDKKLWE